MHEHLEAVAWAEVGEQMQANGVPMKIFVAHTKSKPVALLNNYQKRFIAAGFYIPDVPLKV